MAFSVLAAILLVSAWHVPVASLLFRLLGTSTPDVPRTSYSFITLAYGTVGTPEGISLERVREHLNTLKAGGFTPIGLRDAHNLIYLDEPVPDRAVLITFDQPVARSWRALAHLIRSQGWQAVAFVDLSRQTNSPSWRRLRIAMGEGRWDVGTYGESIPSKIPINADGESGSFFRSMKWLPEPGRQESIHEHGERLHADLSGQFERLRTGLHAAPLALAYPNGSFGQEGTDATLRNLIRLGIVGRHFKLAFIRGPLAHNGSNSDPLRLNRMKVDPSWSGHDLLSQVENSADARTVHVDVYGRQQLNSWVLDRQRISLAEIGGLHLTPNSVFHPARAWSAGSHNVDDAELDTSFQAGKGTLHWWLRATRDDAYAINVLWRDDGMFEVFEIIDSERDLLASTTVPRDENAAYQLRFVLRGPALQVMLNGKALFPLPVRVSNTSPPGYVGVGIAADHPESTAYVRIDSLSIQPLLARIAIWDRDTSSFPVIQSIHQQAYRFTMVSPPLEQMESNLDPDGIIRNAYGHLARWHGMQLLPSLEIDVDENSYPILTPHVLAARIERQQCDGVYIRFTDEKPISFSDLVHWLNGVKAELPLSSQKIVLHIPYFEEDARTIPDLLHIFPDIAITTEDDVSIDPQHRVREEIIQPAPTTAEWQLYYTLQPDSQRDSHRERQRQVDDLAASGHAAMQAGRYEEAIVYYSNWHSIDPDDANPLNFIADALQRLHFRDEAVDFLRQSLEINPGQTLRLVALVKLLDELGRQNEARLLLNKYLLLFPDDPDIQLAQTEWLLDQGRYSEARIRLTQQLQDSPDNFPVALLLLRVADRRDQHMLALRTILRTGQDPINQPAIIRAVFDYDLLTIPGTGELYDLLVRIKQETADDILRRKIASLSPRVTPLAEVYSGQSLSDAWHLEPGLTTPSDAGLLLRSAPGFQGFNLRLLGSQDWQDSFIEATVKLQRGSFWLDGRQTHTHSIRFLYDATSGQLRLQHWQTREGQREIIAERRTDWEPLADAVALRLEVRGKGAMAFVNNRMVFSTPLNIAHSRGGRVALGAEDVIIGQAQHLIQAVSAGPLFSGIAMIKQSVPAEEQLGRLRAIRQILTDLSPVWFQRDQDGLWHGKPSESDALYRIFADYHGIRFMPAVQVESIETITAGELRSVIELHGLDGLVIICESLPDTSWFHRFEQQSEARGLRLLFIEQGVSEERAKKIYGLGPARLFDQLPGIYSSVQNLSWETTRELSILSDTHSVILLDTDATSLETHSHHIMDSANEGSSHNATN